MANKNFEIQRLQARHREIIRLKTIGLSDQEVADHLGITRETVSNTINSVVAQERMEELQSGRDDSFMQAKEELEVLLPRAVEVLAGALDEDNDNVTVMQQVKVAGEVLDRVGPSKTSRVEKTTVNALTPEFLEGVKDLALRRQMQREAIDIVPQVEVPVGGG